MADSITIRDIREADCTDISEAFAAQGWNKRVELYRSYLRECEADERVVLIAEQDGRFAGYVTILWRSTYPPFREEGVPEISDLNVLLKFRRHGIGSALLDEAEHRIADRSGRAGIGVGVTPDYGAAQVLYVKRGYVPDGRGLFYRANPVRYGESVVVDDDLVLFLTKDVRPNRMNDP